MQQLLTRVACHAVKTALPRSLFARGGIVSPCQRLVDMSAFADWGAAPCSLHPMTIILMLRRISFRCRIGSQEYQKPRDAQLPGWLVWMALALVLPACSSTAGSAAKASAAKSEPQAKSGVDASTTTAPVPIRGVTPPPVVPGPGGSARVLFSEDAVKLQRQQDGPQEELISFIPGEQAWGALWSPKGTRVCILTEYKRGSDVQVFTTATQPAIEIDLDLQPLSQWRDERYSQDYRNGRFFYITPVRWIDEDHLEIKFSGNLIPREGDGDPESWVCFGGRARIALGDSQGAVQGSAEWEPLISDNEQAPASAPAPQSR